jgi:hypothetical protein
MAALAASTGCAPAEEVPGAAVPTTAVAVASATPALAPASPTPEVLTGRQLLADDFEDGDTEGWFLHPEDAFSVVSEAGNRVLLVESEEGMHAGADVVGPPAWQSFTAEYRMRLLTPSSAASAAFQSRCVRGYCEGYSLVFWPHSEGTEIHLSRTTSTTQLDLDRKLMRGGLGEVWHTVRIETTTGAETTVIRISVDGMVAIHVEDPTGPALIGGFQLGTWEKSSVAYDDVLLTEIPLLTPLPEA